MDSSFFATWKTFTRSPCLLLFDERMVTLKNFVEGVFAVGVWSGGGDRIHNCAVRIVLDNLGSPLKLSCRL